MKIGIDIDDTITDTLSACKEVVDKYNLNMDYNYKNLDKKDLYKFIKIYGDEIFKNAKLLKDSKESIDYLKQNNEIYLITARSNNYNENIVDITLKYLLDNDIKYDGIYFDNSSKIVTAKKLGIDIMIDDSDNVIDEMRKNNIKAFNIKEKTFKDIIQEIEK